MQNSSHSVPSPLLSLPIIVLEPKLTEDFLAVPLLSPVVLIHKNKAQRGKYKSHQRMCVIPISQKDGKITILY